MTSNGTPSRVADVEPESEAEGQRARISPQQQTPQQTTSVRAASAPQAKQGVSVKLEQLRAFYGEAEQVKGIDLDFNANEVTAIIGPSGCGKSTMVRCINRMHEEIPGARAEGSIKVDELDVYAAGVDVTSVRRMIGMVFQKPNPFPTMSIFDNVAAGLRLTGTKPENLRETVHRALRAVGLWGEVKNLMDEPCSAIDPIATLNIELLIALLKQRVTIVIVTHNMQQAARVADRTAFMLSGELVEVGPTQEIFTNPNDSRTEEYVTGKFG